ncbi:MAG: four helix bundle protein [Bacteroidales bacterium]|nr:four helix bundle protein [Bacteroidales bacterium]
MKNQKAFSNLTVWQESLDFVKEIYLLTSTFPEEEKNGIVRRMKDNAISIPTNISKGLLFHSETSFLKNLYNTLDCLSDLNTLLLISLELNYISQYNVDIYSEKLEKIKSLTLGIINKFEMENEKTDN